MLLLEKCSRTKQTNIKSLDSSVAYSNENFSHSCSFIFSFSSTVFDFPTALLEALIVDSLNRWIARCEHHLISSSSSTTYRFFVIFFSFKPFTISCLKIFVNAGKSSEKTARKWNFNEVFFFLLPNEFLATRPVALISSHLNLVRL